MVYISTVYSSNPRVEVTENIVTAEIAQHFINLAKNDMKRSTVVGRESKENVFDDRRTSSNCWIGHDKTEITLSVAHKISDIVGIPLVNAELFQILYYGETHEYQPHFDAFDIHNESEKYHLSRGGQRLKTALLYFNDVPEGGGTIFPELDLIVDAKMGNMVVFQNCLYGTQDRHPKSLHGGMPVIKGEKWAANLWFREGIFV